MLAQLDTKTVYTFMDSMVTIDSYVLRGKEMGYSHLGIMDRNNLYGAYQFIEACYREGIQPVIGCEFDIKIENVEEDVTFQLLALSTVGYRNLMKISTLKMTSGLDFLTLQQYLVDIAVVLPYRKGIEHLDIELDSYYIGVTSDSPFFATTRPLLPLHTVRLFDEKQVDALQVLHAIRDNIQLNQVGEVDPKQALIEADRFKALFSNRFPQALEELSQLLSLVHYDLDTSMKLPRFNRERVAVEELREKAYTGLLEKDLLQPDYQERLDRELSVIHQMGFDDYFLIVWDLLRFGRSQGYYMGMGRGSAVGSLVAFALNITGIDPVKHQLLFERFLNEERFSMPDIDIDIPDIHRSDFIRYVRDRYGSTHAAQIVTYSTFGAKQAIRDVFKRFGTPEYELTRITKKISFRDTLSTAYEKNASFRQLIQSKVEYQRAFAIAKQIEGQPRQTSIHAAGVVMSDEDLTDTIPLKAGDDMLITQYDAHAVEANGLLKMDFLGLRNLTFVQKMAESVLEKYGKKINVATIDLEDKETLALFANGQTKGIFQFEQPGAISLLKRVRPTCFEDIVATTSLNRPGASDYSENFIRRKHGQEKIDLLDQSIATILEPTYGIMLYQEQVMQIAQLYAGFTLGKADLLRRAMSKKNSYEMEAMQQAFLDGAKALGHEMDKAQFIFGMMAKFAGYGFNRSHAYAYSALAFQLAYFKKHYPDVFFDIMLNYSSSAYITDALQYGFELAKLTINTIPYKDRFDKNELYLGLKNIKGLPREFAYWIIEARKESPFSSVEDFILRLPKNYQKQELLLPLIHIGLFDSFDSNRRKIAENLDNLFVFAEVFGSFFAEETYSWIVSEDYTDDEKFLMEKEVIGVGLSPHPLLKIRAASSREIMELEDLTVSQTATILVQIQSVRIIRTKKTGEQMAFLQVSDTIRKLDVTLFPEVYQRYKKFLSEGSIFYLTGRLQERDGNLQMVLEKLEVASQERFWILLENHDNDRVVATILEKYAGPIPVVLHYLDSNQTVQIEQISVAKNPLLEQELRDWTMKTVFR